jgi:N-acetylglucosaminyl-diphospho-decaprenol L-rhamnosyltransferase
MTSATAEETVRRGDIAAVLVNYNAGAELTQALRSIASELAGRPWEAVVVDNASHDGSERRVGEFAPHARLVRNTTNVGFGRAVNQGVAASGAPLVLVMNPDCRLMPGAMRTLQTQLEAHDACAIVAPRVLDPDGAVQGSARGDPDMLTGLFGRTGPLRAWFPQVAASRRNVLDAAVGAGSPSVEVDWVSGACMLVRRSAFESVGGFDEGYFLYWEDADLCRRLRARGYHVRYVPGATAVHSVGRSSRSAPVASIRAFHASAYRYYATHVAPGALNPKRLLARVLLGARCWWKLRAGAR